LSRHHRKLRVFDLAHFLSISLGSASEARYLVQLATRLERLTSERSEPLVARFDDLTRGLQKLIDALDENSPPHA
jgi:four helix bundle protein